MNYYEHHIRDYDAATAHLSWDEDMAYTRLLRWYYRKERPIPADIKEASRQVRATSKAQREAVATVLNEFFELQDDGWHQDTCDEAIAAYLAGEPERAVKKANEENRLRKHRDERAQLFKILTDAGEHAPWNIKIDALREMASRVAAACSEIRPETVAMHSEAPPETAGVTPATQPTTPEAQPATAPATPATQPATQPETAPETPATATQTPDTRHQSLKQDGDSACAPARHLGDPSEYLPDPTPYGAMAKLLRSQGVVDAGPGNPLLRAWVDKGLTPDEALAGLLTAGKARAAPNPMTWPYLARVIETQRERASQPLPSRPPTRAGPNRQDALEAQNHEVARRLAAGESPP